VGLLVQAMTRFEPSWTAVGALANMMTTQSGLHAADTAANVQGAVIEAGVVPLLVAAMAKHTDDKSFLSACMECLRIFARHNADLLVKAGVADTLFDILHARTRAVVAAAMSLEGGGFTQAEMDELMLVGDSLPVEALQLLCVMQKYEGYRPIDFFAASAGIEACFAHACAAMSAIALNVLTLVEYIAAHQAAMMFCMIDLGLVYCA